MTRWAVTCWANQDHDHTDEDATPPTQCPECKGEVFYARLPEVTK